MGYRLDHIAINCKDLSQSIQFYEKFMNGTPTAIRKGGGGEFCFMNIAGAPSVQLIASANETGINHYGFVTDDIDGTAAPQWSPQKRPFRVTPKPAINGWRPRQK